MATEEQVKKAKEEQEAVSLKNWDTLGVQRKFVSFVRVAGNRWNADDSWDLAANGLYCSKIESGMESVRALKPFSIKQVEPLQRRLFYFEVTVKELRSDSNMYIGMSGPDFFRISGDKFVGTFFGFSIANYGSRHLAGTELDKYTNYKKDDVVGCGLLLLAKGNARIFFTKNGQLLRDPITVDQKKFGDVLYPTVSSNSVSDAVEANFGDTLEAKQKFLFDLTGISVIDG